MTARELFGLALFHLLVLGVGFGVLRVCGLAGARPATWPAAIGAAHLAGIALLGLVVTIVLVCGATLRAPAIVAIAVTLIALLFVLARRVRGSAGSPALSKGQSRVHLVPLVLVLAFIAGEAAASGNISTAWDAAHMWTVKAAAIVNDGNIGAPLFRDAQNFGNSHLDYPLLHPVIASLVFRFGGGASQDLIVVELWVLVASLVLTAPLVLRTRRAEAILPFAVVVCASAVIGVLRGDADVTMAVFLAAGVLCVGRWIEIRDRGVLALGVLMLAAAANTKNEGMVFAAAVLVVAAPVGLRRGTRELAVLGGGLLALVALTLPWRIWVSAHGPFPVDQASLGDALDWGYLHPRLHQLDHAARGLLAALSDQSDKGWVVPALGALGVAGAVRRTPDAVAAYCLVLVCAMGLALVWVYWASPGDGVALVDQTLERTLTGPLFAAAAASALILARCSAVREKQVRV